MLSLATPSSDFVFSSYSLKTLCPRSLFPSVKLLINVRRSCKSCSNVVSLCSAAVQKVRLSDLSEFFWKGNCCKVSNFRCSPFARRCKDWESESGDFDLETEILEFMKTSSDPEVFPTKKELVEAGRVDLAVAVEKKGCWLSFGWNADEEEGEMCSDTGVKYCCFSVNKHECEDIKDEKRENQVDEFLSAGVVSSFSENGSQSATSMDSSVEEELRKQRMIQGLMVYYTALRNRDTNLLVWGSDSEKTVPPYKLISTKKNVNAGPQQMSCWPQKRYQTSFIKDLQRTVSVTVEVCSSRTGQGQMLMVQEIHLRSQTHGEAGAFRGQAFLLKAAEIPSVDTNNGQVRQTSNEMLDIKECFGKSIRNEKESDYLNNKLHDSGTSSLRHLELELSMLLQSLSLKLAMLRPRRLAIL